MNKHEFVKVVANKCGFTQIQTEMVIDEVFDTIAEAIANGEEVSIQNFGRFTTAMRAARECRNPGTGETFQVPEKRAPKMVFSKKLKDSLN